MMTKNQAQEKPKEVTFKDDQDAMPRLDLFGYRYFRGELLDLLLEKQKELPSALMLVRALNGWVWVKPESPENN